MHTGAEGFSLGDLPGMVFAPHWYDGVTLSFKKYFSWLGVDTSRHPMKIALGRQNRVDLFTRQIGNAGPARPARPGFRPGGDRRNRHPL